MSPLLAHIFLMFICCLANDRTSRREASSSLKKGTSKSRQQQVMYLMASTMCHFPRPQDLARAHKSVDAGRQLRITAPRCWRVPGA